MKNFYKIKSNNLLIFWQFKPSNLGGFKKYFKDDIWTYFFPLFMHNDKLCPIDTSKYISMILKKDIKKFSCSICENNKVIFNKLNEIKSNIHIDDAVDKSSYDDIMTKSESYSKLKIKLVEDKVKMKYLFLVLDYADYLKNKANKDYKFELKWLIGDEEILLNLQQISNTGYLICNLSSLYPFYIIPDYDKNYIFPSKDVAILDDEHKTILNESDYEINLLKILPFVE